MPYNGDWGDDVDPPPLLVPNEKERLDAMNKPYDIKRSFWIKDEKEAFIAGEIQPEDGDKVTVKTSVGYNIAHWLEKNKDRSHPEILYPFAVLLFKEEAAAPGIKKQKKGSSFQTVSNFYRTPKGLWGNHAASDDEAQSELQISQIILCSSLLIAGHNLTLCSWHMYMQSVSLACAGELRGKGSED
ncbi:Myosin-16 [Dissostichus eleginoides]|uniref:Myosin-16 n=1 Tax=Dissostichus eleginoides TaxID=100907 RepID=A0AAD9B8D3_DISEL|nr:Myosin-16 [Dissostichus eleginoides]